MRRLYNHAIKSRVPTIDCETENQYPAAVVKFFTDSTILDAISTSTVSRPGVVQPRTSSTLDMSVSSETPSPRLSVVTGKISYPVQ
jgi:hypothetical protein